MQKKLMIVLACVSLASGMAFAYDYDLVENDIGDVRLVSIGGFMFAKPVTVELLPATEDRAACAISCRIIYKDAQLARPNEANWNQVQYTSTLLNGWLQQYVEGECAGADLETLCASYGSHGFVRTLQNDFAAYVEARIAEMPVEQRIDVDAVTVEVQVNDAFKAEIRRRMQSQS